MNVRMLTKELIARPSITPADHGCQDLIANLLQDAGAQVERMRFGEVDNLWAQIGAGTPHVALVGHTDVVPPGDKDAWITDPFEPIERGGLLFGRGAADMKGSVAAMSLAMASLAKTSFVGRVSILLTSDEEGPARDGIRLVMRELARRGDSIDRAIVGEPSSQEKLGDRLRVGRRGSLTGTIRALGRQGHTAYAQLAHNAAHDLARMLSELVAISWDAGDANFEPTTLQVATLRAGHGVSNVIPGVAEAMINARFGTTSEEEIKAVVAGLAHEHLQEFDLEWQPSSPRFLTGRTPFTEGAAELLSAELSVEPSLDTGGGTSDGRFLAPGGTEVLEFGAVNATIHKPNECISLVDLERLPHLYEKLVRLALS